MRMRRREGNEKVVGIKDVFILDERLSGENMILSLYYK